MSTRASQRHDGPTSPPRDPADPAAAVRVYIHTGQGSAIISMPTKKKPPPRARPLPPSSPSGGSPMMRSTSPTKSPQRNGGGRASPTRSRNAMAWTGPGAAPIETKPREVRRAGFFSLFLSISLQLCGGFLLVARPAL